ncbi:MAG: hypothetical protein ACTMIB_12220 [Cellulosimicrobium funkei]
MTEEASAVAPDGPEAPDGRPRRTGRAVTVVLLVLAVGAGAAVSRVDTWWPTLTPTTSRGAVGEVVTAGPVRPRAGTVAAGVTDRAGAGPLTTDGVWVVVDLAVSGTTGEASVEVVELRDAVGRDHEASHRVSNQVLSTFADPDVPEAGTVAVEVPARALEGDLVLRVLTEHQDADLDRPQAIAEVDLGRVAPPAAGDSVETVRPALVPGGWDA